ncbi:hypothetical protein C8Q78DRAFT_1020917 [Trametes maxima]|nr:hypothetical protein C8Q78DRAFT_1020917 [Trametes maxima]
MMLITQVELDRPTQHSAPGTKRCELSPVASRHCPSNIPSSWYRLPHGEQVYKLVAQNAKMPQHPAKHNTAYDPYLPSPIMSSPLPDTASSNPLPETVTLWRYITAALSNPGSEDEGSGTPEGDNRLPALRPRETEYGPHGPFFAVFDRALAIELGHGRILPGTRKDLQFALIGRYTFDTRNLTVYDFGEANGPNHDKWLEFTRKGWIATKEEGPPADYSQYDIIISCMSNGEPYNLQYARTSTEGLYVRQIGLCTRKAIAQCKLVGIEEVPYDKSLYKNHP